MKVLLFGHYGRGNFGDDLLMTLVAEQLKDNLAISTLAAISTVAGADYIQRICPAIDKVEFIEHGLSILKKYDRVLFGGGGTVFDYRANLSSVYALRKIASDYYRYGLAKKWKATRFASIGLGIGPFADARAEKIALNRLKYHDFVFARDHPSYEIASRYKLQDVSLSHDLCFLDSPRAARIREQVSRDPEFPLTFIVRHFNYGEHRDSYLNAMIAAADQLAAQGQKIRWVSFQSDHDEPVLSVLRQQKHSDLWVWTPQSMCSDDVYQMLAKSSTIVTARMHGTYLAGMLNVPSVSVNLHPKLELAAEMFENASVVSSQPTATGIVDAIGTVKDNPACMSDIRQAELNAGLSNMMARVHHWIEAS